MIPSTVILPTENPIDINDIKRALITYDKVYIPEPSDRDIIMPNDFLQVDAIYRNITIPGTNMIMPIPIKFPISVNPLPKVANYDDEFNRVIDECKDAVTDGKIEVFSPYAGGQDFVIGITNFSGLDPVSVYHHYKELTSIKDFVNQMYLSLGEINDEIIEKSGIIDKGGNESIDKYKASIQDDNLSKEALELVNSLCYSRIGNLIKYISYAYCKDLVPYTSDKGYVDTLNLLERNYSLNINQLEGGEVEFAQRLSKVQKVVFQEFIDVEAIESLSVKELLKRRDRTWGEYRESKDKLKSELDTIALGTKNIYEFEQALTSKIKEYKALQRGLSSDVQKTILPYTIGAAIAIWLYNTNFSELLSGSFHPDVFLTFGGIVASKKVISDLTKFLVDYKNQNDKIISHPGYCMYKHYKQFI